MEEPNNDIDTEMLQAQIDLAMAQAQNLVASWLPDSQTTQTSSRTAETEAELQVLLRRPPRYVSASNLSFLLCCVPDIHPSASLSLPPLPRHNAGWASARHFQNLMLLRRRVSCRSFEAVKSTHGRRRTVYIRT